jgi:methionyl-tRNA formyltransferase
VRLVFAGTPAVAIPSLEALASSSHDVVAVLTRPDAPAGRGRTLVPSPVKERALERGLEVLTPKRPGDLHFQDRLRELAPAACPVVAYGALIPSSALSIPTHGWINLHFSLLPAWRGAAPVQHAIMAGDQVTGASTFLIEEGLDTGPTFGVMTEAIRSDDTSGDLLVRLAKSGAGLLVATLDALEAGDLNAVPQPREGVSLAPKIRVQDARIRWGTPALAIDRHIRGCTPAPGAWTTFRGERVKIHPVRLVPEAAPGADAGVDISRLTLAPGELAVSRRVVDVGTGSAAVRLGCVQPHGKKPMAAPDWARGVRIQPGERLADA